MDKNCSYFLEIQRQEIIGEKHIPGYFYLKPVYKSRTSHFCVISAEECKSNNYPACKIYLQTQKELASGNLKGLAKKFKDK